MNIRHSIRIFIMGHTIMLSNDIDLLTKRFDFICDQVLLLNDQVMILKSRINRCKTISLSNSFTYSYTMRLVSLEETRDMFYKLAVSLSSKICELKKAAST